VKRVIFLLVLACCTVAHLAVAQTVTSTSGALNGRVLDNTGGALPGVTVTASSPSMMGTRTTTTNDEGDFRFPAVPPGEYTVTFEMEGFQTLKREGLRIGLGFTATVNAELQVASMTETVSVTGGSPVVDTQSTTVATTFSADKIKNLPLTGEYWSMLSTAPAVQMAAVDVGGSQALSPVGYTVYGMNTQHRPMVEGIVATWGSGSSDMYYADFNSFSEVAMSAAGNGAESPSPGMQSNFISKSGGNQFRGSFYFDYESGDIQAKNITAEQIARGVSGGNGIDAVDTNRLLNYRKVSADVGGYLVKNKLWWYYAYSLLSNEVRLVNVVGQSKVSKDPTHSTKVTYNANQNINLVGYYQTSTKKVDPYLSGSQLLRVTQAAAIWQPDSAWNQDYGAGVYKGEYNHTLSSRMFLEVRAGKFFAPWKNYSQAPQDYRYEDIGNGIITGGGRRFDDIRNRPQLLGSLSYYKSGWKGSHNLKVGGELLRETDEQYDGGFKDNMVMVLRNGAPNQVYLFESPNDTQNGLWARSAYVTDTWRYNNRLTLNLGLRYDGYRPFLDAQSHTSPLTGETTQFAANSSLVSWNHVAPRAGVIYDVSGKGTSVVKVNYGDYWWNPAADFAGTLNPNQLLWWKLYAWNDLNGDKVYQPGEAGTLAGTNGGVASARIDPNLKNTYTKQVMTMFEHEVAANFGVRTGFVWVGSRNLRAAVNQNQPYDAFSVPVTIQDPGPDGVIGTSDDGGTLTAYNLAPQYVGLPTVSVTQNLPDAKDNFYTWEVSGERRPRHGWSLSGSFAKTWNQRSALATNPNVDINRVDGQDHFTSWQAKFSGTFDLPKGIRVSPLVRHQSGVTYGRTFVASLNGGSTTVLAQPFDANRNRNVTILDVRAEKGIQVSGRRLGLFFDLYNIGNVNAESAVGTSSGTTWLRPTTIVAPRIARFGVKYDW
jgi:hypothetical protein